MSNLTRREFIRQSMLFVAGVTLLSCEDEKQNDDENIVDSPGILLGEQPSKQVVIVGAGMSGLVAGYELVRAGHHVTILEARNRIGGRVHTHRSRFSDGHFAEAGAARIPPNHDMTLGYADHFDLDLDPFYPQSGLFVDLTEGKRSFIPTNDFLDGRPWPTSVTHREYVKIRGGTDKLPKAFADAITDNIKLEAPVESIVQDADRGIVTITDGTEFSADRVLCTVPLTVLNKIQFTPQLSAEKLDAMGGGYYYAPSTRIFIQCTNRFWENEGLNGWGYTDWFEEIWQPTWDRDGPRGILMSYLRYDRAEEADAVDEDKRILDVLTRWEKVFPGIQDNVELGDSHSWALDEWSRGAWASPSEEQHDALKSYIGKAEGRIHFAGEHASEYHGWMQGALVSGIRAAWEIHEEPII